MKKRMKRWVCLLAAGLALPAAAEEPVALAQIYFKQSMECDLPLTNSAVAKLAGARFYSVSRTVAWDYGSLDVATPWYNTITGYVQAPEGYFFSCDTAVSAEMAVWDPAGEPFDHLWFANAFYTMSKDMVVPLGTDRQALEQQLQSCALGNMIACIRLGKQY